MIDIILIGGGGHCKVIIDSILNLNEYNIIGIIDKKELIGDKVLGIPIIGSDEILGELYNRVKYAFISLGSIGSTNLRKRLYKLVKDIGYEIPNIIDKDAIISKGFSIGEGNYIGKGVIINSDTRIGDMTIINTGSIVEHDCIIDNFVHISPRVVVSGGVSIKESTHIGVGTTIIENIKIGRNNLIGASSMVNKNIMDNMVVYGNPCREIRSNNYEK